MAMHNRYLTVLVVLLYSVRSFCNGKIDAAITAIDEPVSEAKRISLAAFQNNTKGQAFYHRTNFQAENSSVVEIYEIPNSVAFIIVQVHTQEHNVTLSYDNPANCQRSACSLSGSNIGLEIDLGGNSSARIAVSNDLNSNVEALIAVVGYTDKASIPGGCNMEFEIEVAPYQKLYLTEATVIVEVQPPSKPQIPDPSPKCGNVTLTAYRMYLTEGDYTPETYYAAIQKMITVEDIMKNGEEIRAAVSSSPARRVFSAYPGTGSVYAMIATHGNYSSAYVPAATYACSPITDPSSCNNLNTTMAQALCAIVLVSGIMITFIGHRCLRFEVVFLGAICGGIISFSVLTATGYCATSSVLGIVMAAGTLSGIGALYLSRCMNTPCFVTFLSSMALGFFVASTIYFGIADDTPLFESDVNFWLIYTGVTLLVPIVLAVLPFSSNVVCCAILGSYSIILPIDYYAGSNLKYILINTVRRATAEGFSSAVIKPPYQSTDKWLVAFLIIIALLGIFVQAGQLCCCEGKHRTTVFWSENQPIVSAARRGRRVLVFGENDRVAHSNW